MDANLEYKEFSGKTKDDAITNACQSFLVASDCLDYVVIDEGSSGFLGFNSKPVVIKARVKSDEEIAKAKEEAAKKALEEEAVKVAAKEAKEQASRIVENVTGVSSDKKASDVDIEEVAVKFLKEVLKAMDVEAEIKTELNDEELSVELSGNDTSYIIGKRGQTLDSLQYLISLVINKYTDKYIRVKVDTENYRERRKQTLENLARNIAKNVKRTRRATTLEPMNPYERRIIHSALQGDKYVETHSEGEEPYRKVVISPKRG